MRRVLAVVAAVAGCGEVLASSADPPGAVDAATPSIDAQSNADASAACDPASAFVARKLQGDVNSPADDRSASLTADESLLFFTSRRGGLSRIYTASRDGSGAFVGSALVDLGGGGQEFFVATREDGNRLMFTSNRDEDATAAIDVWFTTRANAGAPWDPPKRIFASTIAQDQAPFLEPDDTLWFSAWNGLDDADIFTAKPTPNGYDSPQVLPAPVNGVASEDTSPVLSRDGLTLYFATTRRRPDAGRSFEIFVATRVARSAQFTDAKPLADLEGPFDQRPSWLSPDGCRLYFYREDQVGAEELWVADRSR